MGGVSLPFCSFFAPVPSSFVIIDLPSPLILTLRSGVLNNSEIIAFKDVYVVFDYTVDTADNFLGEFYLEQR